MMSAATLVDLLGAVPTYTEATFTLYDGRTVRGIARDRASGPGRRWTVNGWEWFIDVETFDRLGLQSVAFDAFTVPVAYHVND